MRGRQLSIYGQFKSLLGPKWTLECVRHELCIRGVHSNNLDWKRFHLFCFMSCYWCCSISMFLERKHLKKWDILVLVSINMRVVLYYYVMKILSRGLYLVKWPTSDFYQIWSDWHLTEKRPKINTHRFSGKNEPYQQK